MRRFLLRVLLLAGLTALIYGPGASGPMVFDDLPGIITNPHVQQIWPLHVAANAPPQTPLEARPIASLSIAANYAVHGFDSAGYRWTNAFIHLLAGVVLMLVAERLVRRTRLHRLAPQLGFIIALIWTVHPLHTDAVAYIVQRSKGLETLFILLSVWLFLRAMSRPEAPGLTVPGMCKKMRCWMMLSVLACLCAMLSKESAAATPLIILLIDRQFVAPSLRDALIRRRGYYFALAACWIPLAGLMLQGGRASSVGFDHGISAWHYLLTQAQVIVWYVGSIFWPRHLVIHHEWLIVTSFWDAVLPGILVLALLALTIFGLIQRKWFGVAGGVFFLMLGPTSSFIPMSTEIVAERRMQLPLAAVVFVVVIGAVWISRRLVRQTSQLRTLYVPSVRKAWVFGVMTVTVLLTIRAGVRAQEFKSPEMHWRGVLAKYPESPVGLNNLAVLEASNGNTDEAIRLYRQAADASFGDMILPHLNLARQLHRVKRTDEAIVVLAEAAQRNPNDLNLLLMTGGMLREQGRLAEAQASFERALALYPDDPFAQGAVRKLREERAGLLAVQTH